MKKTICILSIAALTAFTFINCSSNPTKENSTEQKTGKVYTCMMHPEVISDKPGQCPKCGMDLVEKKVTKDTTKSKTMDKTKKMDGIKM